MNYDTFLFKGHGTASTTGQYDSGAVSGNYKEFDIVNKIVEQALIYLKSTSLKIHVSENNFIDKDTKNNSYKYKCGLSVHINSGGGTGTEIFVPMKEKFIAPDQILSKSISTLLSIPDRGVKSRDYNSGTFINRSANDNLSGTDYYGEIRTAWEDGISLSILEVGFIDTNDINQILNNIDDIAFCIAEYITSICNTTLPNTPTPPKPTTPPTTAKKYLISIYDIPCDSTAKAIISDIQKYGYKIELKEY